MRLPCCSQLTLNPAADLSTQGTGVYDPIKLSSTMGIYDGSSALGFGFAGFHNGAAEWLQLRAL